MWERFTERARKLVLQAQREAARLNDNTVSTEHLLLALVRDADNVACRILDRMGVSSERIRSETERQVMLKVAQAALSDAEYNLSPRGKRVIDLAYDEARQLSNSYIGTEHLLLGLLREDGGLAGRILAKMGVNLDRTRREVMAMQDNDSGVQSPKTSSEPSSASEEKPPPLGSVSSASGMASTAATILVERAFRRLSAQQRQAMQTEGLPFSELPEVFYIILKVLMEAWNTQELVVLNPNGRLYVDLTDRDGKPGYAVHTDVSLLATLLIKDE